MRVALAWVALVAGCAPAPSAVAPASGVVVSSVPEGMGKPRHARQSVTGGEKISLQGVDVFVERVTWLRQPCAPGTECLTGGLIRNVELRVERGARQERAVLAAGTEKAMLEVLLRVTSVDEGPKADVEVTLPLGPRSP